MGGFFKDASGNVAIIFTLSFSAFMVLLAGSIDFSRRENDRARLQHAVDAAALAAAVLPASATDAEIIQEALDFLNANAGESLAERSIFTITRDDDAVTITAEGKVPTTMLAVASIESMDIYAEATAVRPLLNLEVAMVLDNSGSMNTDDKIGTLRDVATDLVDTLHEAAGPGSTVKIGLVPFSATVNVGSSNLGAAWLDNSAQSSIHKNVFGGANANRFSMYGALGTTWRGCVEMRPSPYDVSDEPPNAGNPDTLFVPFFAPDEPDDNNRYPNSYIWDQPPSTTSINASKLSTSQLQARQNGINKYSAQTYTPSPSTYFSGYNQDKGPNFMCDSAPIKPLTTDKDEINAAIASMVALGATHIHQGVIWGLRVLSPGEPFTQGAAYDDKTVRKYLIVLSDGANSINVLNNHNKSIYSSYGHIIDNRLGVNTNNQSLVTTKMNERTVEACAAAKSVGITVYTIAFDITQADLETMMKTCATTTSRYYKAEDASELEAAFESIVKDITQLRLTH